MSEGKGDGLKYKGEKIAYEGMGKLDGTHQNDKCVAGCI